MEKTGSRLHPDRDGVEFINVYSKGRTKLGRALSHFADLGFEHPEHGHFASVEGFWYWMGSGRQHDRLRQLYGVSAKYYGAKLDMVEMPDSVFQEQITLANECKIRQHPELLADFIASTLPIEHYYVYPGNVVRDVKAKHEWIFDHLEEFRRELQQAVNQP